MYSGLPGGFIPVARNSLRIYIKEERTGVEVMKEKITGINRTLFELETGILIYGVVCQLFVLAVQDKAGYSLGFWIGIITAMAGAFHMWWSLDRALDLPEKAAVKKMSTHNIIRYLVFVLVVGAIAVTKIANPLSAFLGIMSLKAAAYMQPFTRKISLRIYGEEILPPIIEEPADGQDR